MAELLYVQSPLSYCPRCARRRAEFSVAPATAEMVAGIVDSEQSMSLVRWPRRATRPGWRVANADRRRGPWSPVV